MFKLGLVLGFLALWGPEKLQFAAAVTCLFAFPLWWAYAAIKHTHVPQSTRKAPNMDYLYSNNPKSKYNL